MRVADIMESRVEVADASTPAEAAWLHMRRRGLRAFAVTDPSRTIGVVTRTRLGGRNGTLHRAGRVLRDFVDVGDVSTTRDKPAAQLARLLGSRIEGCVPVLERGHLIGVITVRHLLDVLVRLERLHCHAPRRGRAPDGARAMAAPADI
jgi:CBS domain-containing protein